MYVFRSIETVCTFVSKFDGNFARVSKYIFFKHVCNSFQSVLQNVLDIGSDSAARYHTLLLLLLKIYLFNKPLSSFAMKNNCEQLKLSHAVYDAIKQSPQRIYYRLTGAQNLQKPTRTLRIKQTYFFTMSA